MVHNGIEYGIMQLISETYEIMKKGLNLSDDKIHNTFVTWSKGKLRSFLIEITRDILGFKEPGSNTLLLNEIKDEARSKGTGKWTSQVAMDLQAPLTAIDAAVAMRDLSKFKALRTTASKLYHSPGAPLSSDIVNQLEDALYFATIVAYAQGMHLLTQASAEYGYGLKLDKISLIWRGGCIIRSAFLQDIYAAYSSNPALPHLLVDNTIQKTVNALLPAARNVLAGAISSGIAMPAHTAAISYLDSLRSERMPSNVIQAQRDYFGAHTYERIGKEGVFHTQWIAK
jgi:6-phosphogluconate dehydrogenase